MLVEVARFEAKVGANDAAKDAPTRTDNTYRHIIGSLLSVMLGKSPGGQKLSVYSSQSAVIDAILTKFPHVRGLSKRTLEDEFAACNRALTLIP